MAINASSEAIIPTDPTMDFASSMSGRVVAARRRFWLAFALAGLTLTHAPRARAEDQDVDERGQSVSDREHSRLERVSIPVGSFVLTPRLDVATSYDDNIFATNDDAHGDAYVTVHPEIQARSVWSRHSLKLRAYFDRDLHAKYTGENTSKYAVSADGRYDISGRTRLFISGSALRTAEDRANISSFLGSGKPVRYNSFLGMAAIEQNLGSLNFRLEERVRRLSYSDAVLADGQTESQKFRNQTISATTLQAGYDLNTITQFVVRASLEKRRYDQRLGDADFDDTRIDPSGDNIRLEAGIVRDLSGLLSLTFRLGYLDVRYPDGRLNDIRAFSYFGNVQWHLTPMTTISATAQRSVDVTTSQFTAGNLRDQANLQIDHELLRSLILSASARLAWIKPSIVGDAQTDPDLIIASSREKEFGLEGRYYFLPRLKLTGKYAYWSRQSSNALISFKSNVLTFGIGYTF